MAEHVVTSTGELADGERLIVHLEGREIAVFYKDGDYYSYANWCPHQSGPVCEGITTGRLKASYDRDTRTVEKEWEMDGKILVCPWHTWKFDVTTGRCVSWPDISLVSYEVEVSGDDVIVKI